MYIYGSTTVCCTVLAYTEQNTAGYHTNGVLYRPCVKPLHGMSEPRQTSRGSAPYSSPTVLRF